MRNFVALAVLSACATTIDGPDAEPAIPAPASPAPTGDGFGLRDADGPVPGLPGFSYVRASDATRCGGIGVVVARDRSVAVVETELAALFELEFPRGLDFKASRETAMKTFYEWLEDVKAKASTATKVYEAQFNATTDPMIKLTATARLAQIPRFFGALLVRAEIPVEVRTGDNVAEKTDAYCDALAEAAKPLLERADLASAHCAKLAADTAPGWWTPVCR